MNNHRWHTGGLAVLADILIIGSVAMACLYLLYWRRGFSFLVYHYTVCCACLFLSSPQPVAAEGRTWALTSCLHISSHLCCPSYHAGAAD